MILFRRIFHIGLAIAATTLLITALAGLYSVQILGPAVSITYISIAIVHVILLALVGLRLPNADRGRVPNSLYTAGFIHTLVGLGTAIVSAAVVAGNRATGAEAIAFKDLVPILASMGAALLPHAIAVWAGNVIEGTLVDPLASVETSILRKLADDAEETRAVLRDLYAQRQALLQQEVVSLKRQLSVWDDVHAQLLETVTAAQKEIQAAMAQARDGIASISTAAKGVASDFAKNATGMQKALSSIQQSADGASTVVDAMAQGLRDASGNARELSVALREATGTVRDLNGLQESIVELLSAPLFKTAK